MNFSLPHRCRGNCPHCYGHQCNKIYHWPPTIDYICIICWLAKYYWEDYAIVCVCVLACMCAHACVRVFDFVYLISSKSLNPSLQGKNTSGDVTKPHFLHLDAQRHTHIHTRAPEPKHSTKHAHSDLNAAFRAGPQVCLRWSAVLFDYTFRPTPPRHVHIQASRLIYNTLTFHSCLF